MRITSFILISLVAWPVWATEVEVAVRVPRPDVWTDRAGYTHLSIEGFLSHDLPGRPKLPERAVNVLIPPGHEVVDVRVTREDLVAIPGRHVVFPAQRPWPLSFVGPTRPTDPDVAVYQRDADYPESAMRVRPLQLMRGYAIQPVIVRPVSYHPRSGRLTYAEVVRVTVVSRPGKLAAERYRGYPRDFERARALVDNPGTLASYPLNAALPKGEYRYVIITSQAMADCPGENLQALAASKESRGITTLIKTTESIYAEYQGIDNAEKVRNFISDVYRNFGTDYVLLAGDADLYAQGGETQAPVVPVRQLYGYTEYDGAESIASDVYYSCLDGNFDSDGDRTYGEPVDNSDLLAEVFVGRAPVDRCSEVSYFVSKTLGYKFASGEWMSKVWMLGEQLTEDIWAKSDLTQLEYGSSQEGITTRGFNQSSFYQVDTLYDRDVGEWSKGDALQILNSGVHIVNHLGHSYTDYCMRLYNSDIDGSLHNNNHFFLYSQGCYPGAFDNRVVGGSIQTADCFTEHLLFQDNGAFAVVSNTRYGWVQISNLFHRTFWDAMFAAGETRLGAMNSYSKESLQAWAYDEYIRWIYWELTLFGDPELSIREDGDVVEPAITLTGISPFQAPAGGANPAPQTVSVANAGGGILNWTASSDAAWLSAQPASGVAPADVTLSVNTAGLPQGVYHAGLTFMSGEASNSPVVLPVELHVKEVPAIVAPFSRSVPVVDGFMAEGEYDAAAELDLDSGQPGVFRVKIQNDGQNLYLAMDAATDGDVDLYDLFSLFFDLNNDGRWPQSSQDEGVYDVYSDGSTTYYPVYNSGGGFQVGDPQDLPPGLFAAFGSNTGHQVAEVRIDLNTSRLRLAAGATFGLYLTYMDYLSGEDFQVLGNWPPSVGPTSDLSSGPDDCTFFGKVTIGEEQQAEDLVVNPLFLNYQAAVDGSQIAPIDLFVAASNNGSMDFGISASHPWIHLSATGGVTPASISVSVDPAGLGAGSHTGSLTIQAPAANNGSIVVPVTLDIRQDGENIAPSAPIPTSPLDYARVSGLSTELVVQNAFDPEGQPLRYLFEVYEESSGILLVQHSENQGTNITIAALNVPLPGNAKYWWRARAVDPLNAKGPWSRAGHFIVDETVIVGGCACGSAVPRGPISLLLIVLLLLAKRRFLTGGSEL